MKQSRHKKHPPRKPSDRPAVPQLTNQLHFLPDGMKVRDFEWNDAPSVVLEMAALDAKWQRWRAAKDLIDADWYRAELERLQEIALTIDRATQATLLDEAEERRRQHAEADQKENEAWVSRMFEAAKKIRDAELAAKWARVNRAGAEIQRQEIRADNKILLERKRRSR
jgi:hypothetical protein